jgi:diguanylate cyclase (GGDEF)-like protein
MRKAQHARWAPAGPAAEDPVPQSDRILQDNGRLPAAIGDTTSPVTVADPSGDVCSEAAAAIQAVREVLRAGKVVLPASTSCDPELVALLRDLASLTSFATSLAQGDLEPSLPVRGSMAGALKSLQASLRHLSWQTQQVAAGDFSQRVDFMGAFADAFNSMVAALAESRARLTDSNEALTRLNTRLETLATTDHLTGAFNRRKLQEELSREVKRARRHELPLSLIVIDLDHFKNVNDAFGHEAGDQVLLEVAGLAIGSLRTSDLFVRWGGEEFVVLTPHTELREATRIAERIRHIVAGHAFPAAGHVTLSAGVAQLAQKETAEGLIARADTALYLAKNTGRDRVVAAP